MPHRTPLVLIPGLLCDAALWAHQSRYLDDVMQVRVPDVGRTGESIKLVARAILDESPPRFALAGLSMGGYIAMEIMRQDPSRILRLALLNTTARPDSDETKEKRRAMIELAKGGKFKGVTTRLLPTLIHPDRLHDASLCDTIMKMAERVGRDAFIREQSVILSRPDSRPDLATIKVPTLVVSGRQDGLTPLEHAQEMTGIIPHSTLAIVEDCGHLSPLERPQAVTSLMRLWLEGRFQS